MQHYNPPSDLLRNRVILITGASTGIGRQVAHQFAAYGATVILLARRINLLESLYDEIVEAGYAHPALYPCNLATASPNDFADLANTIRAEFGMLDGILHNAAKLGTLTPIEYTDIREWYSVMQTNLNAPYMMTRALLPLLNESEDARVVFTEDTLDQASKAFWGAYSVSKHAVAGFRQVLAQEVGTTENIRVNSICPGPLRTSLRARAYPAENPANVAEPGKVMPAYLYLFGPDSKGLNGQCLQIQGVNETGLCQFDITS